MTGNDLQLRGESLAAAFPPLLVAALRVATTVQFGAHGRRRVGPGDTFWQFRRYQPTDAAQTIDWRRSARSTTLYVREKEWDAAATVRMWRDPSPSMAYRSLPSLPLKAERADLLVLALASLLARGGELFALLESTGRALFGRTGLLRLAERLAAQETAASLPPVLPLARHHRVILMSDFLSPLADIAAVVRGYAGRGVEGHLLHVMDPAEETLPYHGRTRFFGLEEEDDLLIGRVDSVRLRYQVLFDAHRDGLKDLARATGWTYGSHRTDHPPETALLGLYMMLGGG